MFYLLHVYTKSSCLAKVALCRFCVIGKKVISLYLWYTGISKVNFRKVDIFISCETERSLNIVYFGTMHVYNSWGTPCELQTTLGSGERWVVLRNQGFHCLCAHGYLNISIMVGDICNV